METHGAAVISFTKKYEDGKNTTRPERIVLILYLSLTSNN